MHVSTSDGEQDDGATRSLEPAREPDSVATMDEVETGDKWTTAVAYRKDDAVYY